MLISIVDKIGAIIYNVIGNNGVSEGRGIPCGAPFLINPAEVNYERAF